MKIKTINDFQKAAKKFSLNSKYKDLKDTEFFYPVLGLSEEVGEVVGKVAKCIRDKDSNIYDDDFLQGLKLELGDVLWFVSEICSVFNFSLQDVAERNICKLESRFARNTIKGSGDNR